MKSWQLELQRTLSATDAPPVLSRDLLSRFARSARNGERLAPSSLSYWIRGAVQQDRLRPVERGLYLNAFRAVPGQPADAAAWLRADAVVSLNTVLGDAGVLNNPVHGVTAVVPIDAEAPPPKLGRQSTRAGTFHFFGMPRRTLEAGEVGDRLESMERFEHPRATPEKALLDWLYLARSPRSRRTEPPLGDLDLELLDRRRLDRLARAAGMQEVLHTFLQPDRLQRNVH